MHTHWQGVGEHYEKLLNLTSKNSINNVGLSVEATAEFLLETNFELIYDLFTQNCPY